MSLLEISRQAKHTSPVFIVGEPRSGSSLLFRTLQKHSSFASREENLQESSFVVQAPSAYDFTPEQPRNMRRYMLDDDTCWHAFLESLRPLRPLLRASRGLDRRMGHRTDWAFVVGACQLVVRSYLHHAARARGCRRILEKTPTHLHQVDKLRLSFPAARMLYIYRHPVDAYSSYVRRGQVDPKAAWARIGPEAFCATYRENIVRALWEAQRRPDSFLLIRYEGFTADIRTELERVCAFLDEPFEPQLVSQEGDEPVRWAPWERSSQLYEPVTTRTKDWRDYLTGLQAEQVQWQLAPVMRRLGYDVYDTARERPTSEAAVHEPAHAAER